MGKRVGRMGWVVATGMLASLGCGSGCASPAPEIMAAREDCRDWMMSLRIGERPEMGSWLWGEALRECTRQRVSPAGRLAIALDQAAR